jgi:FAD/FMN-containing dehydrogenase
VTFAGAEGLPISVRGGGHAVAGHCIGDGAVVVDLAGLKQVEVDPATRRAVAGGGVTWEDFDPVCLKHGLATTGGTFADTGIGGLTLGGGIGFLQGRYGLTVDNLVCAEVVTADGRVLSASTDEHDDLFWAIRGGGGNFGVVTSFGFRLHPITTLLGGLIIYAMAQARDVIRLFREMSATKSDALSCQLLIRNAPEPIAQKVVMVAVCFNGPLDEGERALRALRSVPVLADQVRPMSYLEVQTIYPKHPFGLRHYWKGYFLRDLPDDVIDSTIEYFRTYPSDRRGGPLLEELYGAPPRVPNAAMAFNQRDARFNLSGLSIWQNPDDDGGAVRWAREYAATIEPHSITGTGYHNYGTELEPVERLRAAYGSDKFDRLRRIKRTYDPDNLFRFNQNIPPAP